MKTDGMIELEGVVVDILSNSAFFVDIGNDNIILSHISGKLQANFPRIQYGDKVIIQMTPYNPHRGRIIKVW